MKSNGGSIDRILRHIVGPGILGAGWHFKSWWGLGGVMPILTAVFRFCPAYLPFGLSTCALPGERSGKKK